MPDDDRGADGPSPSPAPWPSWGRSAVELDGFLEGLAPAERDVRSAEAVRQAGLRLRALERDLAEALDALAAADAEVERLRDAAVGQEVASQTRLFELEQRLALVEGSRTWRLRGVAADLRRIVR